MHVFEGHSHQQEFRGKSMEKGGKQASGSLRKHKADCGEAKSIFATFFADAVAEFELNRPLVDGERTAALKEIGKNPKVERSML